MQLNALSEVLLIIGILVLLTWLIVKLFPPRSINALYGYRTPRSMKDDLTWAHAQRVSSRYLLNLALVFLLIGIAFLFIDVGTWSAFLTMGIILGAVLVGFGVLIFLVEKSLRRHFPHSEDQ